MSENKKYTLDNSTTASNPGKVKLKPFVWMWHDLTKVILLTLGFLLCLLFTVTGTYLYVIPLLYLGYKNFYYWMGKKEHFQADSNGGIVISVTPPLVAVSTDLTHGFGNYPVIKVIPYKTKKPLTVGDRIGTVAVYYSCIEEFPHWCDFEPLPIEYATNDANEIQAALDSYPTEQWQTLTNGIQELEKPYEEGLFRIQEDSSDWEPFEDEEEDTPWK